MTIPNLDIQGSIKFFALEPTLGKFLAFILTTALIGLILYLSAAIIIFIADIIFGTHVKDALRNITKRSLEEPLIFISTGILISSLVTLGSMLLPNILEPSVIERIIFLSFWPNIMVGFYEEFSKHLVVRFSDDNAIYSIDSAIEFSIMVGLGFAFFENIIYFIDRGWLARCIDETMIANKECVFDIGRNYYVYQVGSILGMFIFRSLLSMLAHVVFSGIFGYFFGVAHFASYELKEQEKKRFGTLIWGALHRLFRMKTKFVFHEMKIMQGLLFAMFFHGIFNFFLEHEMTYVSFPMILLGFFYLWYLINKKDNHKRLRLIVDTRTSSSEEFQDSIEKIEMLEKFEIEYKEGQKKIEKKQTLSEIEKNVELLEKYEQNWKKKEQGK